MNLNAYPHIIGPAIHKESWKQQ